MGAFSEEGNEAGNKLFCLFQKNYSTRGDSFKALEDVIKLHWLYSSCTFQKLSEVTLEVHKWGSAKMRSTIHMIHTSRIYSVPSWPVPVPSRVFLCPFVSFRAFSCLLVPFRFISCLLMPSCALSFHFVPFSAILCLSVASRALMCHFVPCRAILCLIVPSSVIKCKLNNCQIGSPCGQNGKTNKISKWPEFNKWSIFLNGLKHSYGPNFKMVQNCCQNLKIVKKAKMDKI